MESKDENVALKATNAVLDRAFGRPAQQVELKSKKRDLLEYSLSDLWAMLEDAKGGRDNRGRGRWFGGRSIGRARGRNT